MTFRGHKSPAGFTLVELLIGATLSAAIMAAVLSSYIYLGRSLTRLGNQQALETEARRTLGYFTQDVLTATGLSGTPSASSVTFTLPAANGTMTVAYAYDSTAGTLTRTPGSGTAVVLLRNITSPGCIFRYYDSAGSAYDNGSSPYTTVTTYSAGIKQVSLQFSTQVGNASNGTRTQVYQVASSRLVLRNKTLLP